MGVLGTLTAQMASTAAAVELAEATDGDKFFYVKATGFDLALPSAACSPDLFALRAVDLPVRYVALANDAGKQAQLSLSEVSMKCGAGSQMVYAPFQMSIAVSLRLNDAPTEDDRATRVDMEISQALFSLTKGHYAQLWTCWRGTSGLSTRSCRTRARAGERLRSCPNGVYTKRLNDELNKIPVFKREFVDTPNANVPRTTHGILFHDDRERAWVFLLRPDWTTITCVG